MIADELQNTYENEGVYKAVLKKAMFQEWIFIGKVKQEVFQDEVRVKTPIQSLHKIDFAKEGRSLLNSVLVV